MPRAWISLGANLGRPQATLTAAAKALEQSEGIAHLRLSSFYVGADKLAELSALKSKNEVIDCSSEALELLQHFPGGFLRTGLRECRGSSGHELFARGTSEAFAAH